MLPFTQYTVKQDSTNYALDVDMDQSQFDYPASIWLVPPAPPVLVYDPDTYGECCCDSFLSLYGISFYISLSSDI